MPTKKQRVLRQRAVSWNVLSGNVPSPSMMRIPLVTNTVRLPLVTGGVPFSMNRGVMPGLKHNRDSGAVPGFEHDGEKPASHQMLGSASGKGKVHTCPWCGASNIGCELKGDKRSLWRCLGCNRRWWASADNPRKMAQHRPKLSRQVYQGSFWRRLGGLGG